MVFFAHSAGDVVIIVARRTLAQQGRPTEEKPEPADPHQQPPAWRRDGLQHDTSWLRRHLRDLGLAGGKFILGLLTNNSGLIDSAMPYIFWVALVPLITFPAFLFDGIFIGATASAGMRNTMILATLVFYLPVYYLLRNPLGNHGLWLAFMSFMIGRGVLMWVRMKKDVFREV